MKVAHLVPQLSQTAGGLTTAVNGLARALVNEGIDVVIFAPRTQLSPSDQQLWNGLRVIQLAYLGLHRFAYMPGLRSALREEKPDVVHTHGLWTYLSVASSDWSKKANGNTIVAPHGMLDPVALKRSWFKKRPFYALVEQRHLQGAGCIHAVSAGELKAIRALQLNSPVCIIPNGITLPASRRTDNGRTSRKRLLFVGRIHPKKGLATLLDAYADLYSTQNHNARDWTVTIAGWDEDGFQSTLMGQVQRLGIGNNVEFVGPVVDSAKANLFAAATAFTLPSMSEGLPVAVLEAWAHALPVLMTDACNFNESESNGAAIVTGVDRISLRAGLETLFGESDDDLRIMGERGRSLVEAKYSWPLIAREMRAIYEWLAGGRLPPRCARLG